MATETVPLSGSTDFGAIAVGTGDIASGTIIHTATSVPGEYDEVNLTVQNVAGREVGLSLCIPLLDPDAIVFVTVPRYVDPEAAPPLQNFWMTDGSVLRASATEAGVVMVKGHVARQAAVGGSTNKITSIAPSGHFRVTNIYVDSATGKLVTEYDNTPAP